MKLRVLAFGLLTLPFAGCGAPAEQRVAELLVRNADLRTQDTAMPRATAMAVGGGRILYVGDEAGARAWTGRDTRVVDAGGHTVLPGLVDSHIHAAAGALSLGGCTLHDESLTIAQAAEAIRECARADAASTWLVVNEVNPAGFKANRQDLDAIERQRPLFLWGSDGHTAWVNSRALELAKVTRGTADPADGRIERDARGDPTGFLIDGATSLVSRLLEQPSMQRRLDALRTVLPMLHAAGITSYFEANTDEPTVAAYAELSKRDELTARVTVALASGGENTPAEFARLEAARARLHDSPLVRADFIKLFADGVMEFPTQTAALREPYNDAGGRPGTSHGNLYLAPQAMSGFIAEAGRRGFNIHVHAIGDAAVREALDAFAAARAAGSRRLFSIAHLQLIDAADLARFASLDVGASVQLLWAQPDNYSIDALTPWIGPERLARLYPARSLLAAGATLAGGSDWDVSSFNPFEAMATAMSRRNPERPDLAPLNPREALTLDEMLLAYTLDAARLIGRDQQIGSLAVGKLADFIVLDRTLTGAITADEVRAIRPSQVFFSGRELPLHDR